VQLGDAERSGANHVDSPGATFIDGTDHAPESGEPG
jgi:hypothetical protein